MPSHLAILFWSERIEVVLVGDVARLDASRVVRVLPTSVMQQLLWLGL